MSNTLESLIKNKKILSAVDLLKTSKNLADDIKRFSKIWSTVHNNSYPLDGVFYADLVWEIPNTTYKLEACLFNKETYYIRWDGLQKYSPSKLDIDLVRTYLEELLYDFLNTNNYV